MGGTGSAEDCSDRLNTLILEHLKAVGLRPGLLSDVREELARARKRSGLQDSRLLRLFREEEKKASKEEAPVRGSEECSDPDQSLANASRKSAAGKTTSVTSPKPNIVSSDRGVKVNTNIANVGDHKVPALGEESVRAFLTNNFLDKIFAASGEDLGRTYSLSAEAVRATGQGDAGGIACAIADPNSEDCPLVFVSANFEALTGYSSEFSTGRNCRFLQPTSRVLNDAINKEERARMREFCTTIQPAGTTIITLLLNERNVLLNEHLSAAEGERFWNLLRMQYIEVEGHMYIFGVQTCLDAYMPKLLSKKELGQEKNKAIADALGPFIGKLTGVRKELCARVGAPFMECKGYFTCAMNYVQLLPSISNPKLKDITKTAEAQDIRNGSEVVCIVDVIYPASIIPAGSKGHVTTITSFGDLVVDWSDGIGSKTLLARDKGKVKVVT